MLCCARVSTAYQVHHQTIEQQLERLSACMEQQGLVLSEQLIVRDDSYGGARLNRPGLDRVRDAVQERSIDRLMLTGWRTSMCIKCCCSKSSTSMAARSSLWTGR